MVRFKVLKISGKPEYAKIVKKKFGHVLIEFGGERAFKRQEKHKFKLQRLPNYYTDSKGKKPLFVLIPDEKIQCIWPEIEGVDLKEIKYGTANGFKMGIPSEKIPGFVIQLKEGTGLYICLVPTSCVLMFGSLGI